MTYAGQVGVATFRMLAYRAKVDHGRRAVNRPDRERDRLDLNPGMLAETAIGHEADVTVAPPNVRC